MKKTYPKIEITFINNASPKELKLRTNLYSSVDEISNYLNSIHRSYIIRGIGANFNIPLEYVSSSVIIIEEIKKE